MEKTAPSIDSFFLNKDNQAPPEIGSFFKTTKVGNVSGKPTVMGLPKIPTKRFELPLAGPASFGANIVDNDKTLTEPVSYKDIPYIASKAGSDYLFGIPEIVAKNPVGSFTEVGARASSGTKGVDLFPKPDTKAGEKFGQTAGLVSAFLPTSLPAQGVKKIAQVGTEAVDRAVQQGIKDVPKGLKMVKREGLKNYVSRAGVLKGLENVTSRMADKEVMALKNTIKAERDAVVKQLNQVSRQGALEAQKALPKYFAKRSREYGKALENIISTAEGKGIQPSALDVSEALGKTVKDLGIDYAGTASPIEQEIKTLFQKYSQQAADQQPVRFDELIAIKKRIENLVNASKQAGNVPYGAGEHSLSSFRENLGEVFEKYLPELKDLNKNYAPFIKLKKQATRIFKPFAGEFETKGGEALLKRSGLPRIQGSADEAILRQLEKETGVPFASKSRQLSSSLEGLKDARRIGVEGIRQKESQRLIELGAKKRKVGRNIGEAMIEGVKKVYKFGSGRIL